MEGCFLLRPFLFRGIFMRFLREMQMPCKWVSLYLHRGPVGVPTGVLFARIFERKKYICVHFLDPEHIKILSLGAIWNFSKGTRLS
jgi:hypothetical protein